MFQFVFIEDTRETAGILNFRDGELGGKHTCVVSSIKKISPGVYMIPDSGSTFNSDQDFDPECEAE